MCISPCVGVCSAPAIVRNVLFPEPEGPTIATNSPLSKVKDVDLTASII